jgi:predicted small secreted protein
MSVHALPMSVFLLLVKWVGCKMTRGFRKDIEVLGDAIHEKSSR